jgi:hypothetical protein
MSKNQYFSCLFLISVNIIRIQDLLAIIELILSDYLACVIVLGCFISECPC